MAHQDHPDQEENVDNPVNEEHLAPLVKLDAVV